MTAQTIHEEDFPKGHPKRFDYDPKSLEAKEWARLNIHPKGERDFPVDHPKAVDTKGNTNAVPILPGVDPANPHLEAFTGATPEVAAARKAYEQQLAALQKETPTTPEGFVDTAKIAHDSAVAYLVKQGHTEDEASRIIAREGIDQVLAAKATTSAEG